MVPSSLSLMLLLMKMLSTRSPACLLMVLSSLSLMLFALTHAIADDAVDALGDLGL
jgi:hypothetical protein